MTDTDSVHTEETPDLYMQLLQMIWKHKTSTRQYPDEIHMSREFWNRLQAQLNDTFIYFKSDPKRHEWRPNEVGKFCDVSLIIDKELQGMDVIIPESSHV